MVIIEIQYSSRLLLLFYSIVRYHNASILTLKERKQKEKEKKALEVVAMFWCPLCDPQGPSLDDDDDDYADYSDALGQRQYGIPRRKLYN